MYACVYSAPFLILKVIGCWFVDRMLCGLWIVSFVTDTNSISRDNISDLNKQCMDQHIHCARLHYMHVLKGSEVKKKVTRRIPIY